MDLRKIIRKVLIEEFDPKRYLIRRMESDELEREFNYALDYVSKGFRKVRSMRVNMTYDMFKNIVTSMTVSQIEIQIVNYGGLEFLNQVTDFVYEMYKDRIKERYEELTGTTIKENVTRFKPIMEDIDKKHIRQLVRRFGVIDGLVTYGIHRPYSLVKPCDYKNYDEYFESISYWICQSMYYDYFSDLDDSGKEWGEVFNLIVEYIDRNHGDDLRQYFEDQC